MVVDVVVAGAVVGALSVVAVVVAVVLGVLVVVVTAGVVVAVLAAPVLVVVGPHAARASAAARAANGMGKRIKSPPPQKRDRGLGGQPSSRLGEI